MTRTRVAGNACQHSVLCVLATQVTMAIYSVKMRGVEMPTPPNPDMPHANERIADLNPWERIADLEREVEQLRQLRGFLEFFVRDAFKVAKTSYGPTNQWMDFWKETWPEEYDVATKARAALQERGKSIKWTGENWPEVFAFIYCRDVDMESFALGIDNKLKIKTSRGVLYVHPGQYIVRNEHGELSAEALQEQG